MQSFSCALAVPSYIGTRECRPFRCKVFRRSRTSSFCGELQSSSRAKFSLSRTEASAGTVALPEPPVLDESYELSCTFAEYANWILPGRVMLGRYPFVEPSRCRSANQGEAQLKAILEAGITTFVCLQDELPEQAAMKIGGVDGFLPYRATATLLASALSDPPSLEEISALRTPDLDKFLPPRRKGVSPASQRRRIELDFVYSPIIDLGVPSDDKLAQLLDQLVERMQKGERLYIHCWGGRGRAGTVGACLLAKLYGMGAEEALCRVNRAFSTRKDGTNRSPETNEQQEYVTKFIASL